jgi:hypothetical protein
MSTSQEDSRYLLYSALLFLLTFFICSLILVPISA